ncbi:CDP-glycerol glycerophosphotransferase [Enterococcus sp. DIV2371]|uniref:CDP-glycerol glycerophosphotransferase n=1 Tax=Candidatus Enterococcus mangumiae TaxID=2230878 RepID=A0ABZ2SY88_9ENTE|nr:MULTISPECIES: CDP-glycerol glycerophosphotransferase family protein [unclassified Enterococcus]MBO0460986.1 CDP-glycerol glycerophosphotransferase family protein [Enterococcus sp. DIV1298c]MBO0490848.1 CDP-glycerol glycerophosphotransferase family protein [Enterococcus sp. DIV1094]
MIASLKNKITRMIFVVKSLFLRVGRYAIFYCCYPFLVMRPLNRNKIVVSSYFGKGYGDNPKYICEYLLSQKDDLDIVWLCKPEVLQQQAELFPDTIRLVKNKSVRALIEMFTAKIWIDNCRKSFYPPKRKGQFYLQTWHAGFGLKRIENNAADKLKPRYVKLAKKDSQMCDLLVFESSDLFKDIGKMFWYDGEIFREGVPRNDVIVNNDPTIIRKVYDYYQIPADKKIVLYAPTFRAGELIKVSPDFLEQVRKAFTDKFGVEYMMLIRLHPNDTENKKQILGELDNSNLIDASDYNDMQELLCATDILITDYSSTIGEALVSDKKCFIYAYDYDQYLENRGLVMDLADLPFPLIRSQETFIRSIEDFDLEEYLSKMQEFKKDLNISESGHASKTLGDRLLLEMSK